MLITLALRYGYADADASSFFMPPRCFTLFFIVFRYYTLMPVATFLRC